LILSLFLEGKTKHTLSLWKKTRYLIDIWH
jgi:hypothetical protein